MECFKGMSPQVCLLLITERSSSVDSFPGQTTLSTRQASLRADDKEVKTKSQKFQKCQHFETIILNHHKHDKKCTSLSTNIPGIPVQKLVSFWEFWETILKWMVKPKMAACKWLYNQKNGNNTRVGRDERSCRQVSWFAPSKKKTTFPFQLASPGDTHGIIQTYFILSCHILWAIPLFSLQLRIYFGVVLLRLWVVSVL